MKGNNFKILIRSVIHFIITLFLITAFWLVLAETFTLREAVFGFFFALIALLFTNYLILDKESYSEKFFIPVTTVIVYAIYLLYQIYAAGFSAMKRVITGHIKVCIVEIETSLDNDFLISLLANSITLTPGTVTLDRNGEKLKIIWLSDSAEDPKTRDKLIKGRFESILKQKGYKWTF